MKRKNYKELTFTDDLQDSLDDGNITIIVNSYFSGNNIEPELKAFLSYVNSGRLTIGDILTKEIDEEINTIKTLEGGEVAYMSFEEKLEDAREEGKTEGKTEAYVDLVKENLISINIAAEKANMSVEEFQKLLDA